MQEVIDGGAAAARATSTRRRCAHFDGVCSATRRAPGSRITINPRLVRGLDYYNLTVFEWITDRLGAQGTVCGGGRYDGLFEQLGGKPTPGVRLRDGRRAAAGAAARRGTRRAGAAARCLPGAPGRGHARLRVRAGARNCARRDTRWCCIAGGGSFKSQMKKADASGAALALIVGEDELEAAAVTVKPLRDARPQQRVGRGRTGAPAERISQGNLDMALQNLDLEEQEQLAELKAWWQQYGNLVLLRDLAALAGGGRLAAAGAGTSATRPRRRARCTRRWPRRRRRATPRLCAMPAARSPRAIRARCTPRWARWSRRASTSTAASLKSAKAQLQWVVERSPSEEFRDLARLRLGARAARREGLRRGAQAARGEATAQAYAAQFAALKGDMLAGEEPASGGEGGLPAGAGEGRASAAARSARACRCASTRWGAETCAPRAALAPRCACVAAAGLLTGRAVRAGRSRRTCPRWSRAQAAARPLVGARRHGGARSSSARRWWATACTRRRATARCCGWTRRTASRAGASSSACALSGGRRHRRRTVAVATRRGRGDRAGRENRQAALARAGVERSAGGAARRAAAWCWCAAPTAASSRSMPRTASAAGSTSARPPR